jgi:hypothetical protein
MKLELIHVRPEEKQLIVEYSDLTGRMGSVVLDAANNATVSRLISEAEALVPSDANHPNKPDIQLEISQLEDRIKQLRRSIGQT